jgi:hypothetical protein
MFPSTAWAVGDQINDYTAEYAQINYYAALSFLLGDMHASSFPSVL